MLSLPVTLSLALLISKRLGGAIQFHQENNQKTIESQNRWMSVFLLVPTGSHVFLSLDGLQPTRVCVFVFAPSSDARSP